MFNSFLMIYLYTENDIELFNRYLEPVLMTGVVFFEEYPVGLLRAAFLRNAVLRCLDRP